MTKTTNTKQKASHKKKNSSIKTWGGLVVIVIILIGAYYYSNSSDLLSAPATMASIDNGKKIFNRNCVVCHGENGKGENATKIGGGKKSNGSQWAPALNGNAHSWHHKDRELFNTIKFGSSISESPMRGFEGKLADAEIVSVLHYVKSLWPMEIKIERARNPHH